MRLVGSLFAAAAAVLLVAACGDSYSGTCNICPSATFTDLGACAAFGAANGCEAAITTATDDDCSVGQPATSHQVCEWGPCSERLVCSTVTHR